MRPGASSLCTCLRVFTTRWRQSQLSAPSLKGAVCFAQLRAPRKLRAMFTALEPRENAHARGVGVCRVYQGHVGAQSRRTPTFRARNGWEQTRFVVAPRGSDVASTAALRGGWSNIIQVGGASREGEGEASDGESRESHSDPRAAVLCWGCTNTASPSSALARVFLAAVVPPP